MNLKECREQIDKIDEKLIELLTERMDMVREVAVNKAISGLDVLDTSREEEKLSKVRELSGPEFKDSFCEIFKTIMDESKKFQEVSMPKYGLLGRKLGHSFSPKIHNDLGGYQYGLFQLEKEELDPFFAKGSFKGINVTTPYKKEALRYCSKLSDQAAKTGSVNTIVREDDGTFTGYNTDYYGFKKMLTNALRDSHNLKDKKVIILGNGGVCPTVKAVLEDEGFEEIVVISRRGEDNYENLSRHYDAAIVINTTPVGMYPLNGDSPINLDNFNQCLLVLDLIYNPLNSQLVIDAKRRGILARGGLEMLVYQGIKAVEIFTGKKINEDAQVTFYEKLKKDYENIVLIGMPGSGKSTKGKELSQALGRKFIDTDEEIFAKTGKRPEAIILESGEDEFRKIEAGVLKEVCRGHRAVIATGGGVVTREENRNYLEENSTILYLKRDLDELESVDRPLSKSKGVERLFEERAHLYEEWSHMDFEEWKEKQ